MDIEIKKYLFDIKESIDSIEKYLGDKRDFKVYMTNKMLPPASAILQIVLFKQPLQMEI